MQRTFEKKYSGESERTPKYSEGDLVTLKSARHPLNDKQGRIEKSFEVHGNVFYDVVFDKVTKHLPERMLFPAAKQTGKGNGKEKGKVE